MKRYRLRSLLLIAALFLIAWDLLLWHQTPGINFLLLTIFIIILAWSRDPECLKRRPVQLSAASALFTSVMLVLHGPGLAMWMNIVSILILSVTSSEAKFRSVFFSVMQGFVNFFAWSISISEIIEPGEKKDRSSGMRGTLRMLFFPLLIVFMFFLLYSFGNPHFGNAFKGLFEWIDRMLGNVNFPLVFFTVFGCWVLAGLFIPVRTGLESADLEGDELIRVRRKKLVPPGMAEMRRSAKTASLLLIMLNVLLLLQNSIDVRKVWINFVVPEHFSLKEFVHQGTWILSISILLSMIVLLFVFRGNMPFYRHLRGLKSLAYVWILQNAFLALSLFKRNYHYIDFHGLAYGRIGVIVWLFVVFSGLITFTIKISRTKSFYYLLRMNSLVAFAILVLMCSVNWDKFIVDHNLHHTNVNEIDVDFYLEASDDVLPILEQNKELIHQQISAHARNEVRWISYADPRSFDEDLINKEKTFISRYGGSSWPSWNLSDAVSLNELKAMGK